MPRFVVKEGQSVTSGKVYLAGAEIELTSEQAASMPWAVEPVVEVVEPEPVKVEPVVEDKPKSKAAK